MIVADSGRGMRGTMLRYVERLAGMAMLVVIFAACDTASAEPNRPTPPLASLPVLLAETDLVAVGTVGPVSDSFKLTELEVPVQLYEVSFEIEQVLAGERDLTSVTVRVPFYYLDEDGEAFSPTKIPNLRAGERTLLFLTDLSPYADGESLTYVTAGGGVVSGKFNMDGDVVRSIFRDEAETTLDAVIRWLRYAGA